MVVSQKHLKETLVVKVGLTNPYLYRFLTVDWPLGSPKM
jgi:hypothetical protein